MKTVLITGANRGIGLELARLYAKDGADVLACCRAPDKAAALRSLESSSSGRVRILPLDVSNPEQIAALASELKDAAIDILINNAGISGPKKQNSEAIDAKGWLETFSVNTIGPVLVSQAFRAHVKRSGEKKIVAITSMMGSTQNHSGGMYAYRSSKAALNNAMHGLSREWAADGITIAILHPGWVRTDMGGKNAAISPEESASGLKREIDALRPETSGHYRDYAGSELTW